MYSVYGLWTMNKKLQTPPQIPIRRYLPSFRHSKPIAIIPSVYHSNCLLDQLWKSGRVDEARHVFDKMPHRDEFSWNTMIDQVLAKCERKLCLYFISFTLHHRNNHLLELHFAINF